MNLAIKTIVILIMVGSSIDISIQEEMKIIGHRGAMGYETENSLLSLQKALDLNVDMIEIDVFKIKSGEIVVFHDEKIDRLTSSKGSIESLTLQELKSLKLKGGHSIPTLTEALDLINHKVPVNIELKGAHTAKEVDRLIEEYCKNHGWTLEDFVISSFDWTELKTMRSINSDIAIAVLTEDNPLDAIEMAKELKAFAINPDYKTIGKKEVEQIHRHGYKVYAYTVNKPEDIEKMKDYGVDGIFTNYPDRAR